MEICQGGQPSKETLLIAILEPSKGVEVEISLRGPWSGALEGRTKRMGRFLETCKIKSG